MSWQSIETAPKDGTWVLLWQHALATQYAHLFEDPYLPRAGRWDESEWRDIDGGRLKYASHWMPLPEPPR